MYLLRYPTIVVLLLTAAVRSAASEPVGPSPLKDAVAVWNMADADGRPAERTILTVHGNVRLGVNLKGSEREASLRRGGDGRVAQFGGGYLIAGEKAAEALRLGGDKMTFCIRLRDPAGKWNAPLFSRYAPKDEFGKIFYPAPLNKAMVGFPQLNRIKEDKAVEFLWRTTPLKDRVRAKYYNEGKPTAWFKFIVDGEAKYDQVTQGDFVAGVLRLQAPIDLIGPGRWHDVVVRFNRAKLDLFVDGVLLDEDWPHGKLHRFMGPFLIGAGFQDGKLQSGFHGQIDHVALWDRALTDEEIAALCGGDEEAAQRDVEILGSAKRVAQYWRPRGYNKFIGDCMTFSHDGTFHVFFLSDRGHGAGKWGMLGSPWGHVSTKDLIHWKEHPCPLDVTEPWECCLGTGCIVYHDGKYRLFYIKHDRRAWFKDNPNHGDAVFVATSDDAIHFKKDPKPLFVPEFFNLNDINPDVYPNETDGGFLLSLSNWKVWKSDDLVNWKKRDNLTTPKWWICTSYFKWNDWYYFNSCGLHWRSRQPIEKPSAKWDGPPHQTLADGIRVPQVAAFKNRHIMVGFTPEPTRTAYAGELLVRELIQHPDGTLGTKWPAEMIPKSGKPLKLSLRASAGDVSSEGGTIRVSAPDSFAVGTLDDVPQNVRITLRVKPKAGTKHFGICVRGKGDYESGCELQFVPARQHVQFAPVADGRMAKVPGNWMAIGGVTGMDKPFTLDVIVKDDLVDACIDNRRTIITRNRTRLDGDRLFFFVDHGEVTFENIQVRPLREE
jgi:beta-fructofuranosidase